MLSFYYVIISFSEIMLNLTVHHIGLIKVGVCLVDFGSIAVLANVVVQVPALVFIKHSKHGVLLLVCSQLYEQTKNNTAHRFTAQ